MNYAGFWRRFAAMLIDALILLLPSLAIDWIIPFSSVIMALLYFPIFESSAAQATPGKYVMGLKVMNENGGRLSFGRAVGRYAMKYVSTFLLLFGYIMQVFTVKRQTLHDMVVQAVVVNFDYKTSPDWIGAWVSQMRWLLRVDDKQAATASDSQPAGETIIVTSTASTSTHAHPHNESALEAIEKLHALFKQGALSEDEYQAKKADLLKQV